MSSKNFFLIRKSWFPSKNTKRNEKFIENREKYLKLNDASSKASSKASAKASLKASLKASSKASLKASPMEASPMDVSSPSQMDDSKSIEDNTNFESDIIMPLSKKNKTSKMIHRFKEIIPSTIKEWMKITTIPDDIARCDSILRNRPSDNKFLNNLINERNSTSCFMQVIYGDASIKHHINEIKKKIIEYNARELGFMVIYGGTSWNENFSQDKLDKLDATINTESKVDEALRNVSFLKKNYDVLVATSDKDKIQLATFFTNYLNILKVKINIVLDRYNITCKCKLETDIGTSGIGTILNDKKCYKYRLLLDQFTHNESRDFDKIDQSIYALLNTDEQTYISNYNKPSSRRNKKTVKVRINSGCNNELAFYIELGHDSTIDTKKFKDLLIHKEYLNETGCFIIQSFLNTDRRDKGINIDEIRRFYCIRSIITRRVSNKEREYYDKIIAPFKLIFGMNNNDIIEKIYLYAFKMFNVKMSQEVTDAGVKTIKEYDYNKFLDDFNNFLLESKQHSILSDDISIREYSNLLFMKINEYLITNNYGLLAKAGGECMRYYIRDEKQEIKTKDFDCKLFITKKTDAVSIELIKKKILLLIVFTSVFFNKLEKFKNVNNNFTIYFAGNKYTINLNPARQSNLFSSRVLYDFNVPLFSLDLRILYTINIISITNKTKKSQILSLPQHNITGKKRTILSSKENSSSKSNNFLDLGKIEVDFPSESNSSHDLHNKSKKIKLKGGGQHIIKNYLIETPIDIAITPDKIKQENIDKILLNRPGLPPILTLTYLKKDVEHTLNHPKSYLNRLFAGKIQKDKTRLGKLKESNDAIELNNSIEYIQELDKLPEEESKDRLSTIFEALLECDIDTNGNYIITYTDKPLSDEYKELIDTSAILSKKAQGVLHIKKRFKTPFSLELLDKLINSDDDDDNSNDDKANEEEDAY